MIKINGVKISTPSNLKVGVMDLSEAERNANGLMIIERIAKKRKLDMSWNILKSNELSVLLKAVSSIFFDVEYIDPETNGRKTGIFYVGDRSQDILFRRNNELYYKDIKFNIIER